MSRKLAREDRVDFDAYNTPPNLALECVRQILPFIAEGDTIWEPHVGNGAFALAFWKFGLPAWLSDINPGALALCGRTIQDGEIIPSPWGHPNPNYPCIPHNFLEDQGISKSVPEEVDWIIGNPPYEGLEKHLEKAIKSARNGVAFLIRVGFLCGQERYENYWSKAEWQPSDLFFISRRPAFVNICTNRSAGCNKGTSIAYSENACPNCGGRTKPGTDATDYVFAVWRRGAVGQRINWIKWV